MSDAVVAGVEGDFAGNFAGTKRRSLIPGGTYATGSSDQFSDVDEGMFYQRVVFDYSDMLVGPGNTGEQAGRAGEGGRARAGAITPASPPPTPAPAVLEKGISEVARKYSMEWTVSYRTQQKRMALLVRCGGWGVGVAWEQRGAELGRESTPCPHFHSNTHAHTLAASWTTASTTCSSAWRAGSWTAWCP